MRDQMERAVCYAAAALPHPKHRVGAGGTERHGDGDAGITGRAAESANRVGAGGNGKGRATDAVPVADHGLIGGETGACEYVGRASDAQVAVQKRSWPDDEGGAGADVAA